MTIRISIHYKKIVQEHLSYFICSSVENG